MQDETALTATAPHYLLAGDVDDLPLLRRIVASLPADAYGQIFIEVLTPSAVPRWDVPAGMTVTWLRRDRDRRAIGGIAPRGEVASRAVMAWVAEWIPERQCAEEMPFVLWMGCAGNDEVGRLYHHLLRRFGRLHLHHPEPG